MIFIIYVFNEDRTSYNLKEVDTDSPLYKTEDAIKLMCLADRETYYDNLPYN